MKMDDVFPREVIEYDPSRPWTRCESTIEVLMFTALLYAPWEDQPDRLCAFPVRPRAEPLKNFHPDNAFLGGNDKARFATLRDLVVIEPQFVVDKYRCDFAVIGRVAGRRVLGCIVECDGAEFHTKEDQVERDWIRQQVIEARLGVRVLRFSGSEIFRDPNGCAARVVRHIRGYVPAPKVEEYGWEDS